MPLENYMRHVRVLTSPHSSTHFIHSHCFRAYALHSLSLQECRVIAEMLYSQRRGLSSQSFKTWNIRALPKGMKRFSPSTSEFNQASSAKQKLQLERKTLSKVPVINNKIICTEDSHYKNEQTNTPKDNKEEEKQINEFCNSDNLKTFDGANCEYDRKDDMNRIFANNVHRINEMKQHALTSKTIQFVKLPPWPVDRVEYNTRASNGGHDKRLAFEREMQFKKNTSDKWHEGELVDVGQIHRSSINIKNNNVAKREGRRHKYFHSLQQEDQEEEQELEEEFNQTKVEDHKENLHKNVKTATNDNDEETEEKEFQHTRIADEIRSQPVGRIINVRNRFNRWTCTSCKEINSLQSTICRRCAAERFHMTLRCTYCNGMTQLSNKLVYGDELCDSAHYTMNFGMHNSFARLAPEMKCIHCHKSLHGAAVEIDGRRTWWCACGCCSHNVRQSCMRCRLPRSIPLESILQPLLQHKWDFRDSSCWYCEGCDGVNRASRYVVALYSPLARQLMREHQVALRNKHIETNSSDNSYTNTNVNSYPDADLERGFLRSYGVGQDGLRKEARLISGDVSCRHCELPWHHQLLRNGSHWRCACHALNAAEDTQCKVCDLPALDMLSANVISLWSHGDWYCTRCHRHCYRLRPQCICGARRVALPESVT